MNSIRRKSDKYIFYEALERRLPQINPYWPILQKTLRKERGGFAGELRVDRELSEGQYFESYLIVKDLLVGNEFSYCQIDSLVIYSKFVLIIEVKNIPGILTYDEETHQLTRRKENGPIEAMGNPEDQLKRSERMVRNLLARYQIQIPVHGMIVFSNPSSILEKPFPKCHAIHVSGLYQSLEDLHQLYADHTSQKFDHRKLHQLFMLKAPVLTPNKPTHIPTKVFTELTRGVLCPNCVTNKLEYKSKYWRCSICKFKSEKSHLETLQEYCILFSDELTTSEWMKFTGLKSLTTTRRILCESNLEKIGGNKNRKWLIKRDYL
ncbi:MAG: nuclease-related domain-containing protein [Paenisporosarcina sp.]